MTVTMQCTYESHLLVEICSFCRASLDTETNSFASPVGFFINISNLLESGPDLTVDFLGQHLHFRLLRFLFLSWAKSFRLCC